MDIKKFRNKLDCIDQRLKKIFIERMKIILAIKKIKSNNKINIYNETREKIIKSKLIVDINLSNFFKILYNDFLENIFKLSKLYQLPYDNNVCITQNSKIIFYIKNQNINELKKTYNKQKFIKIKSIHMLINHILNNFDSIGIIEYSYINNININDFVTYITTNNLIINIVSINKNNFFFIKGENKNVF